MSESRSLEVVFPGDTNHMGTLFGGTLMAWMDRAAYFAGSRRARGIVVTRKVDELEFRIPIRVGDFVELLSHVESEGRSSMVVSVEVHRESPETGARELCTTGCFTMVAVDDAGRPRPLPPRQGGSTETPVR
jgi:acyl-CoA hydrolase